MIYDLIIIGGGPAGSAAAVYASRKRLKTLFITREWGGQSIVSDQIFNWIGSVSISGAELANNLRNHVLANTGKDSTLETKEGVIVTEISKDDKDGIEFFIVRTEAGEEFSSRTILIATGSNHRRLEAINAGKLEHKGLTYCASCDGPLFTGMDVAVVGGGNAAFESAAQLLAYCKSVTLLNRSDKFRADEITVDKVLKKENMRAIKNVDILEIKGEKFVEGILYKDKITGTENSLKVSGIFVEIGQIPNTAFLQNFVPLDDQGKVKINPLNQKTEVEGIWAAGDCTNVLYHQNNIAAGDAVRALEDIYLFLNTK